MKKFYLLETHARTPELYRAEEKLRLTGIVCATGHYREVTPVEAKEHMGHLELLRLEAVPEITTTEEAIAIATA